MDGSQGEVGSAPRPIFVVGAPRSGKTSLARALARHSELWGSAMESFVLPELFGARRAELLHRQLLERPSPTWLRVQRVERDEFVARLGAGIDALFTARSAGGRWIDHTTGNVSMLDTLRRMFPEASFVHVLRDGRLAVQSMLDIGAAQTSDEERFRPRWTSDFRDACRTWAEAVESATRFCREHPDMAVGVRPEELVREPRETFERIFALLRVPFEERPLAFWTRRIEWRWRDDDHASLPERARACWARWSDSQRELFLEEAGATLRGHGLASPEELASPGPESVRR